MRRTFASAWLGLYLAFLLALTLLMFGADRPGINLVPFRSIAHDWRAGGRDLLVNFLGNIAAFAPFGLLLPVIRRRPTRAWHVALACAVLSGTIEVLQYVAARRVADVDDVLLNTAGGLVGYAIVRAVRRWTGVRRA